MVDKSEKNIYILKILINKIVLQHINKHDDQE